MHEGQCPVGGNNAVVTGLQVLGGPKLIAALKGFALGHHDILRAPVFVGDSHIQFLSLALHIDMDNGLFDVSPQLDADDAIRHLDIAFVKVQNLTETTHIDVRRQTDTETTGLEQGVILVERATTRQIEQHVAIFRPDVHTNVATAARHRLRRVLARRVPLVVLGLAPYRQARCPQSDKQQIL